MIRLINDSDVVYAGSNHLVFQNKVLSYNTIVGIIDWENGILFKTKWNVAGRSSSPTTTSHINKVAKEFNLKVNDTFSKHLNPITQ